MTCWLWRCPSLLWQWIGLIDSSVLFAKELMSVSREYHVDFD
ncbi:hypothetical protein SynA1528_01999 [Synechococcus sp. A15-28]|nr:hypothetical protein SynA1528_01999 [Synechococcus sp. A15-28]